MRKIQLVFDDEYDYDIAKMMDILKRNYPQTQIKQGEIFRRIQLLSLSYRTQKLYLFHILGDFRISETKA